IEFRDRQISFRSLRAQADRVAAGLMRAGVGRGQSVGLYLPNTPWHPVIFFAVARTGARVVHLSALDAPRELAHKLHDSGARVLITTNLPGLLPMALGLLDQGAVETLLVGEDERWGPAPAAAPVPWGERVRPVPEADPPPAWPALTPADICVLQYTGGTTGLPKGAMLSHGNLTAAVSIYRNWREGGLLDDGRRQRVIAVLPLFHIYALTVVLLAGVARGWELLLRTRFDVATALDDIGRKRATYFPGVPTMWIALANAPEAQRTDFSSLQECGSGGAPMPFDVQQRVTGLIGRRLGGGWGMTETSPAGTRIPAGAAPVPGLIGIPLPGIDMIIVDRNDPSRRLPPDEIGEIAIRGPNVFHGYWNKPEETRAAFHDGFFLTGDIGAMDARGLFRLLDRKKNMILSGGFNVYPTMIEAAIYEHPAVAEVIVIGIPDAYRGQAAKAFVTLKPGAAAFSLDELKVFLADKLGRHEIPAALEFRPSLPRSPAGKLLAQALRDEESARHATPTATG
ncbi:MAG: AMP-binding protein, partial [Rhodospirillales bacterium]|nr:AMP-binding protein [Rhodospirillales bacterium]